MDLLPSVLAHPLPLTIHLIAMATSSWPPLAAITSSLLLSPFPTSINPFALVSPSLSSPSSAIFAIFCTFALWPGLPVLRLTSPSAATPGVMMAPGWPLLRAWPRDDRGIQSDMWAVVVMLSFAAPPALGGLAPLQWRPDRPRASSTTTTSYLATGFVQARLSVELISQMVLAIAKVWIVCGSLVGVVVSVLVRVNHQGSIQVGLHVWTDVTCKVHLQGKERTKGMAKKRE